MTSDEAREIVESLARDVAWPTPQEKSALRLLLAEHAALRQRVADLEAEHISREDREQALELAKEAEQASVTPCGHSDAKAFDVKWAEARRLLKLDGEG